MMNRSFWAVCGLVMASMASAQIKINEFSYDDITTDDQEFVELYNAGNSPVDISGYVVECGDEAWPTDDNADVTIPGGTIIPAKGFYLIAGPNFPNRNLTLTIPATAVGFFEENKEFIALKNAGGTYLDSVAYECNKATTIPPQFLEGGGLFGNQQTAELTVSSDGTAFCYGRFLDGVDTNVNGRDFGNMPRTPGAPNNPGRTNVPYSNNFDSGGELDFIPYLAGNFRDPRIVVPGLFDAVNLNLSTPSPQGGNCMMMWDWAGGGNVGCGRGVFSSNQGFEAWVYIDTTAPTGTELDQWSLGVLGTSDPVYNQWDVAASANGNTGVAWNYSRRNATRTLTLADCGKGGLFATWTTIGTVDMTNMASGWYRLRLDVIRGKVTGYFGGDYGSTNTGTILTGTATRSTGQFYMGFREGVVANDTCHPIVMDDLRIYDPATR